MSDEKLLERIVLKPNVMVGKPVIKRTRLTVEYNRLTREDIQACLLFATRALSNSSFMPLIAEAS